jgi:hypothetical protein
MANNIGRQKKKSFVANEVKRQFFGPQIFFLFGKLINGG